MDAEAVTRLLKLRSQLTRNPYGADTIAAWTEALADVDETAATDALRAVAASGEASIGVPQLRAWLRDTDRRTRMAELGRPAPRDTGCHCQPAQVGLPMGSICDMHRRTGLDNIARIRAERTARLTPPPKDAA